MMRRISEGAAAPDAVDLDAETPDIGLVTVGA
jgi:hypothetical protein